MLRRHAGHFQPRAWEYDSESEPPRPPSPDGFEDELRHNARHGNIGDKRFSHVGGLQSFKLMPMDVLFEV